MSDVVGGKRGPEDCALLGIKSVQEACCGVAGYWSRPPRRRRCFDGCACGCHASASDIVVFAV